MCVCMHVGNVGMYVRMYVYIYICICMYICHRSLYVYIYICICTLNPIPPKPYSVNRTWTWSYPWLLSSENLSTQFLDYVPSVVVIRALSAERVVPKGCALLQWQKRTESGKLEMQRPELLKHESDWCKPCKRLELPSSTLHPELSFISESGP